MSRLSVYSGKRVLTARKDKDPPAKVLVRIKIEQSECVLWEKGAYSQKRVRSSSQCAR